MDDATYDQRMMVARHLAKVQAMIDEHDFMVQAVAATEQGFYWLYTIGLSYVEHPELCLTTADVRAGHQILNHVGRSVIDGSMRPRAGQDLEDGGLTFRVLEIDPQRTVDEDWFGVLHQHRGTRQPLAMLQIVWPGHHKDGPEDQLTHPSADDPWRDQPLWGEPYWE